MQKKHTYAVDGLINGGGLISGWAYIQNIHWQMDGLIFGGLKTMGGLKVGFYGILLILFFIYLEI